MEPRRKGCRLVLHKDSGRVRWCFGEETKWQAKTKLLVFIPLFLLAVLVIGIVIAQISKAYTHSTEAISDKENVENERRNDVANYRSAFLISSIPLKNFGRSKKRKRDYRISNIPFERGRKTNADEVLEYETWKSMLHEESIEEVRLLQSKVMKRYMNISVDPCNDFYNYACGNWKHYYTIPADHLGLDTFELLRTRTDIVLRNLLEENIEEEMSNLNLPVRKKRDELSLDAIINENCTNCNLTILDATIKAKLFYQSCMNLNILNDRGIEPLLELLKSLGGWPVLDEEWNNDNFEYMKIIGKLRLFGLDVFITEWVGADMKHSKNNVIQIDETTLGMPSREYFLDDSFSKYLTEYRIYMEEVAKLLGAQGNISQEIEDIVQFEIKLATITSPTNSRNMFDAYQLTTPLALYLELHEEMDWKGYFDIVQQEKKLSLQDDIVIYCRPYLKKLLELINGTPTRTVANYVMWRLVRNRVVNLDGRFEDARHKFYQVTMGRKERPPRWKICVSQVNSHLGMAMGKLFVENYFNEISKNDALLITMNLQHVFKDIINNSLWMDSETKRVAHEKTDAIRFQIGYPDFLLEKDELSEKLEGLVIHPDQYFENTLNILLYSSRKQQLKLRTPVDRDLWHTGPAMVNAYYSRNKNQIIVPASLLQPPFYHRNFPKALNYGGIGVIIGHEITHGFDDKGRLFDKQGNLQNWWRNSSIEKFLARAHCLIEQFNRFTVPEINERVNGFLTRGENIADDGGIRQAFKAYKLWLENNPNAKESLPDFNLTGEQLFFLSFAQVWCGMTRTEYAKTRIKTALHSPGRFRVIGTLSNLEEFAQAFKCPANSPMNPENKCTIW